MMEEAEQIEREDEATAVCNRNKTVVSLLSLSRAGTEAAKSWWQTRFWVQTLVLGVAIGTMFVPANWAKLAYGMAISAWLIEIAVWLLGRKSASVHSDAEKCRRRAMLIDAFGKTAEVSDVTDLRLRFSERTVKEAEKLQGQEPYYASELGTGALRLKELLQESAFFSKHLFATAAQGSLINAGLLVIVALVAALSIPLIGNGSLLLPRGIVVFLGFVVGFDVLGRALDWNEASKELDAIDRKLTHMDFDDYEPVLSAFADYHVCTKCVAPIPSRTYTREKERLTTLWSERREAEKA